MSSTAAPQLLPTSEQLLFAKSLILTFALWPALRLAVSSEWGGPDSADKRDFLISHLADTYAGETGYSSSSLHLLPQPINPSLLPQTPDLDDLAELLENYFQDEFEARLDDGSSDWVARRILDLHKGIFGEDKTVGEEMVRGLENAELELRGSKNSVQKGPEQEEHEGEEEEEEHGDEEMKDGTDAGGNGQRRQRQEPEVDEDGFTTVVSGRRR